MHVFLLRCPDCKNTMNYHSKTIILNSKRKRCVYCGRSYKVREQIIKRL